MSELPEVRRADCGHGYLPGDAPPAAVERIGDSLHDRYLCEDCRARVRGPRVETKDVEPDVTTVTLKHRADASAAEMKAMAESAELQRPLDAAAEGRKAALANEPRAVPSGIHPRSAWARAFLAAYDEAKEHGETPSHPG